jgi:uncharacterized membrane protein YgcG
VKFFTTIGLSLLALVGLQAETVPACQIGTAWAVNPQRQMVAGEHSITVPAGGVVVTTQRDKPGSNVIVFRRCRLAQAEEVVVGGASPWFKKCGQEFWAEGWVIPGTGPITGATGPVGPTGLQGTQGPVGPTGPAGSSANADASLREMNARLLALLEKLTAQQTAPTQIGPVQEYYGYQPPDPRQIQPNKTGWSKKKKFLVWGVTAAGAAALAYGIYRWQDDDGPAQGFVRPVNNGGPKGAPFTKVPGTNGAGNPNGSGFTQIPGSNGFSGGGTYSGGGPSCVRFCN